MLLIIAGDDRRLSDLLGWARHDQSVLAFASRQRESSILVCLLYILVVFTSISTVVFRISFLFSSTCFNLGLFLDDGTIDLILVVIVIVSISCASSVAWDRTGEVQTNSTLTCVLNRYSDTHLRRSLIGVASLRAGKPLTWRFQRAPITKFATHGTLLVVPLHLCQCTLNLNHRYFVITYQSNLNPFLKF